MKSDWSSVEIQRLYRLTDRIKSKNTLHNAEKKGEIPRAKRIARGSVHARVWDISQLPEIGKKFGFLKPVNKKVIISIYSPKGGVLKSTIAYNIAKILALNGIKTLIIDLEIIQSSITDYAIPSKKVESLEELNDVTEYKGLYHFFFDKVPINEIILSTSIPTLDVIPQTPYSQDLELKLFTVPRKEFLFKEKLIPHLPYDVIVFDNGAGLNPLAQNSLCAANNVLIPMGCEFEAFKSLDKNLALLFDFKESAKLEWDNFFQLPTLIQNTKVSQQIKEVYIKKYPDIIPIPIRRSSKGEEARAVHQSALEYAPTSDLAHDYYDAINEIWRRISEGAK